MLCVYSTLIVYRAHFGICPCFVRIRVGFSLLVFRNRDYSLYKNVLLIPGNELETGYPKQRHMAGFILEYLGQLMRPWQKPDLNDEALECLFRILRFAFREIDISPSEKCSRGVWSLRLTRTKFALLVGRTARFLISKMNRIEVLVNPQGSAIIVTKPLSAPSKYEEFLFCQRFIF